MLLWTTCALGELAHNVTRVEYRLEVLLAWRQHTAAYSGMTPTADAAAVETLSTNEFEVGTISTCVPRVAWCAWRVACGVRDGWFGVSQPREGGRRECSTEYQEQLLPRSVRAWRCGCSYTAIRFRRRWKEVKIVVRYADVFCANCRVVTT